MHDTLLKITQEVTERHRDYYDRISLLAQGWRKKSKPEDKAEKDKVRTEGTTTN